MLLVEDNRSKVAAEVKLLEAEVALQMVVAEVAVLPGVEVGVVEEKEAFLTYLHTSTEVTKCQ